MMKLNATQQHILTLLAKGQCVSGHVLGQSLQMSRTAIWKHIKQLSALGVPIQSKPKQGYYLSTPIHLLSDSAINAYLAKMIDNYRLHLYSSVDSTNTFLKHLPFYAGLDICLAEQQTSGRGRLGKQWVSPFGQNIYLSLRLNVECSLARLSALSLVVSLSICSCLEDAQVSGLKIKWPNDIIWQDKKLCGNLIELLGEAHGQTQLIIGIGLNVHMLSPELASNSWCTLQDITGHLWDRNALAARLTMTLTRHITLFLNHGFSVFQACWQQKDYLASHVISFQQQQHTEQGLACGVNDEGYLIVQKKNGSRLLLSAGDVHLIRKSFPT
ncbi:MAG: biotin--[acetyl-CoA-carboxylase] ligase [Legionellaceae bacterium]|nr:biotin--[acetyl-CoA-carboxylase] ligase [Legionellaceae bacterium]|tara:strand:+ start:438 stop:1421 length:984 start_codon:yes stop_codon:yes gene_type:complete